MFPTTEMRLTTFLQHLSSYSLRIADDVWESCNTPVSSCCDATLLSNWIVLTLHHGMAGRCNRHIGEQVQKFRQIAWRNANLTDYPLSPTCAARTTSWATSDHIQEDLPELLHQNSAGQHRHYSTDSQMQDHWFIRFNSLSCICIVASYQLLLYAEIA